MATSRHSLLACATWPCWVCAALTRALEEDLVDLRAWRPDPAYSRRLLDRVFVLALAVDAGAGHLDVARVPAILETEHRLRLHEHIKSGERLAAAVTALCKSVGDDPWTHSDLVRQRHHSATVSGAATGEGGGGPARPVILSVPAPRTRGT